MIKVAESSWRISVNGDEMVRCSPTADNEVRVERAYFEHRGMVVPVRLETGDATYVGKGLIAAGEEFEDGEGWTRIVFSGGLEAAA